MLTYLRYSSIFTGCRGATRDATRDAMRGPCAEVDYQSWWSSLGSSGSSSRIIDSACRR